MADTLLNFTQAMSGVPDNTSQLVTPRNLRELQLSAITDRGAAYAAVGPWTVPIPAADVWVDIPSAISADMTESPAVLFWRMDTNGHLFYNYAADWPTIDVPPGLIRAVILTAVIGLDPGGPTWEFAFTIDGVPQEPTELVETSGQTDAVTVTLIAGQGIEPGIAPPVSVSVKNNSNGGDLDLLSFGLNIRGGPLK